jgi:hypothetical protein
MNGQNTVSHSWVAERLSEYIDNQLEPRARAQLEQHLSACDACQKDLASLRWTVSLVKHAPAPALPRTFVLPVPARRAPLFGFNFATMRLATVVATLLLFIVVASDFVSNLSRPAMLAATRAPAMQELAAPTSIALVPTSAPPTSAPRPTSAPAPTKAAEVTKPAIAPAAPAAKPPEATRPAAPTFAPAAGSITQDAAATITPSRDNQKAVASPTLAARVFSTEPVTITIAPTQVPPTVTLAPSPTATATSAPSATALPTRVVEARAQPTLAPPPLARDQTSPPLEPFRIAEIGLFFFVVFFAALAIFLRANK